LGAVPFDFFETAGLAVGEEVGDFSGRGETPSLCVADSGAGVGDGEERLDFSRAWTGPNGAKIRSKTTASVKAARNFILCGDGAAGKGSCRKGNADRGLSDLA
jgi:hypothetical protein